MNNTSNTSYLLMFASFLLYSGCSPKMLGFKNEITKDMEFKNKVSVFKDGTTLNVDFSNIKGAGRVVFFDSTCVITGLNDKMHMLVAQPKFDPSRLPSDLQDQFFDIGIVNLSVGNPFNNQLNKKTRIPQWLKRMPKLSYLRLEDVELEDLSFLQNVNLRQLILIRVEFKAKSIILNNLSKFKSLNYLVSNNLFTPNDLSFLKKELPGLEFLTESDYIKKVEEGKITLPE